LSAAAAGLGGRWAPLLEPSPPLPARALVRVRTLTLSARLLPEVSDWYAAAVADFCDPADGGAAPAGLQLLAPGDVVAAVAPDGLEVRGGVVCLAAGASGGAVDALDVAELQAMTLAAHKLTSAAEVPPPPPPPPPQPPPQPPQPRPQPQPPPQPQVPQPPAAASSGPRTRSRTARSTLSLSAVLGSL